MCRFLFLWFGKLEVTTAELIESLRRLVTKARLVCISHMDLIMDEALKYKVLPRVVTFNSKSICLKTQAQG